MASIKPYNSNQKGGSGQGLFAILIIGAIAYFGYTFYKNQKDRFSIF